MIEKLLCQDSKIILDSLQLINENGKGVVFVVNGNNELCGILTDGDVRRSLLGGHSLQAKVRDVLHKEFVFARASDSKEDILGKLNDIIRILPIVDDHMRVVDYAEFRGGFHIPVVSPDLKGNEFKYLVDAFLSTWISSKGKYIERFEKEFAAYIGTKYGVAVSNGTVALHLALLGCAVGSGDEVIVPDLTFAATINAVLHAQATPVIVDIEKQGWGIDPKEFEKAITPKTKAVIPVHLYGQPCDMQSILAIAQAKGIIVIEDAAEAHGAKFNARRVGSLGQVGCFSFFGNKIITCGEGGMCLTNDRKIYEIMLKLRDHGMSLEKKYWHDCVGYNYRMTNLQAAIGVAQLERIEDILKERQRVELMYRSALAGVEGVEFQQIGIPGKEKITWLVSILLDAGKRDLLTARLKERGFDVRNLFYPLSDMNIYKKYVFSSGNSKDISRRGISLPSGREVTAEMVSEIVKIIKNI